MDEKRSECYESLNKLFEKYKDNSYIQQRIYNHVVMYLPNTIDDEFKNYEKRQNLNVSLTQEQQIFIQIFLSKNNYYYLNSNNFFYKYDGTNYFIIKEDEIIHKLLSTITNERLLLQWKHKTKINILKQIKDRHLFTSIPETDTIQNVLNSLSPLIFSTKNAAKYFLTIIGDNILKKNTNLIFLVNSQLKQFLNELSDTAIICVNHTNVMGNFMTKYHENHLYENCRLIKINTNFSNDYWRDMLKKIGLNLLCVSVYYSKRYENSDKFIERKADEDLKTYTYYLKNNNQENIVNEFCDQFIIDSDIQDKLEWKNIHFIWKQFLSDQNFPNIMYTNNLKNILKSKYTYDENNDLFYGITSKYLPIYKEFINFWNSTIKITTDLSNNSFYNELEIDELCFLFKIRTKQNISEEVVFKILTHFFPHIEIIDNKFILNVTSSMWNKISDITGSFHFIKDKIQNNSNNSALISLDDMYDHYKHCCLHNSICLIVSKRYFENYIYYKLSDFIIYDKFIKNDWIYS
jgi:hypothetical protein